MGTSDQEVTNANHYVEWIGAKIEENNSKITLLEDANCETGKLYVNGLKHNKIALKLIEFLR